MTTLAANAPRDYEDGIVNEHPMLAADIIYEGAAVGDNGSGYARPLVAADPFLGFSETKYDNSAGAAGAVTCRVRENGLIKLSVTGVTALTDRESNVYASDDNTFTLTKSTNTLVGRVYRWISGTNCIVEFDVNKILEIDNADISATAAISGSKVNPVFATNVFPKTTTTTITTAGAETLTAAQLIGGLILRDPAGGARTDTTDTAANVVAAISEAVVGSSFEVIIRNDADAAETITIAGGSGVTTSGTMTIAQNNIKRFRVVLTNVTAASEAATIYSLGTVVF
jgi:hypothetical protein